MKRSLKIAFAIAVTITVLTMGQPLYAQPTPKSRPLPTPIPRTLPAPTPPAACCSITAINTSTGVVTAKENATGKIFQFKVANAALLNSLKVGQGVYANFATGQVSLDGSTMCCSIISPPQAPAPPAAPVTAPKSALPPPASAPVAKPAPGAPAAAVPVTAPKIAPPPPVATKSSSPGTGVSRAVLDSTLIPLGLPSVTAGTPQLVQNGGPQMAPIPPLGNRVNTNVLHLRGPDGIQQATNLSEGAKNLLLLHAYTLGPGEVDHYIVNTQLAEEWIKAHPALAKVQPPSSHDSHAGCSSNYHGIPTSTQCAGEAAKHVVSEAERQSDAFLKASREEWQHVTHELSHDLNVVEGCFADQTLPLSNIPVKFSVVPSFALDFEKHGKTTNKNGSASGTVKGELKFGVPLDADFTAEVDMFYIPCIPFVIRPKSIRAAGTLASGNRFGANLTATGQFSQEFTIPPGGGPHFPIEIIPIIIAGVPIVELDISVYVDGKVYVDGDGKLDANFSLETHQKNEYNFDCNGHGCTSDSHPVPAPPETTSESVKLDGRVHLKPAVYTALQLDFDVNALSARAGPQPYLLAEVYGCGAASATQVQGGSSTAEQSYAATADLDWGIDLRAEALMLGKQVGQTFIRRLVSQNPPKHIAFWDLAHSTALLPRVQGLTQASMGQPALYQIKMPACYPYPDKVRYQVAWTGGATASSSASGTTATARGMVRPDAALKVGGNGAPSPSTNAPGPCNLQPGQGYCEFDPVKNFALDLAWPAAGTYNLAVTAVGDTPHGREYKPPQPTTLNVTVQ
jgi:hypothetical protein